MELANAIRYNTGSTHQDVLDAVDNFLGLKVNMVPTTDLIKRASENAFNYGITIYDAVYIALAEKLGYEFITADGKLYEKIKDLEYVKLLKER